MRVTVSDPAAIPDLLAELRSGGCVAGALPGATIDVVFPWVETLAEARAAIVELVFFLRACEAARPGLRAVLGGRRR